MTDKELFETLFVKVTATRGATRVFRGHLRVANTGPRSALKAFHAWCAERFPGGTWHYYNDVVGRCRYETPSGITIRYRGYVCLDMASYERDLMSVPPIYA